jgi:uncharacterized membrane protein
MSARPIKTAMRFLVAAAMVFAGVKHFTAPAMFVKMVPAALPAPGALVAVSGFFEILGGVGLLAPWPRVRRAAAWGLIALFVAVFPANINMAINHISPGDTPVPDWALWLRLPFQAVFIGLASWFGLPDAREEKPSAPAEVGARG